MDEILNMWAGEYKGRDLNVQEAEMPQKVRLPVGANSPWGKIQHRVEHPSGAIEIQTASHGGVKLYAKLNKQIPAELRAKDGWYEEDLEIAIPMYFGFIPGSKKYAKIYYERFSPGAFDKY